MTKMYDIATIDRETFDCLMQITKEMCGVGCAVVDKEYQELLMSWEERITMILSECAFCDRVVVPEIYYR